MRVFCMDGYDAGMVTDCISRHLGIPIEIVNSPEEADSEAPLVWIGWQGCAHDWEISGVFTTEDLAKASSDVHAGIRLNEVINR